MGKMFWLYIALLSVLGRASGGAGAARLVCYVEGDGVMDMGECTHLVYTGEARGDKLDAQLKNYKQHNQHTKILLRVSDADKDFRNVLKSKYVQGLEVHDAHKSLNRTKVLQTLEAARTAISQSGGGPLFLALPAHSELLAKYYDLRALVKVVDMMMVQTHALGVVKNMTYHPSRLSGLWDMMNTDSIVDLTVGLGVPASKIVISLPATAHQFTLVNESLSTPGSPTLGEPLEIDQAELCRQLSDGKWTLERDQDLSAPYAFKNKTWISFEDSSSVDVKGKYARVRGLGGLALRGAARDAPSPCAPALRAALAKALRAHVRAPRAAVLRSLEHDILSQGAARARALAALQLSPYRITQIVDSDGVIHSIREDTRTEFSCSRQGYFVHPRSCARFYRCVKFDQLSPDFTVFEFDCPSGLAFDARLQVCAWPGALAHAQACPGSSEVAPVPRERFVCPPREGYYADPENCRWFFACIDHGKAPLSAYEFRCPFGLGFDAAKLKCDWPWLVPACGNIGRYEAEQHGFSGAILTGATGFYGQTADAVNVAAHQSLASGAAVNNLVGIQTGFLSQDDALDNNFIASQELGNSALGHSNSGFGYHTDLASGSGNVGLVQATNYNDNGKYTSGSLILDEYRLPKAGSQAALNQVGHAAGYSHATVNSGSEGYSTDNRYSGASSSFLNNLNVNSQQYQSGYSGRYEENSGAYVHDSSGDHAEPYKHVDAPAVPYIHDDQGYRQSNDYNDYGRYSSTGKQQSYGGQYTNDNSGQYVRDDSGSYNSNSNGEYKAYNDQSGKYIAGVYRSGGEGLYSGYNGDLSLSHIGASEANGRASASIQQYQNGYSIGKDGYLSENNAYAAGSHALAAGAINVGLVGKTSFVDADYIDQTNYFNHGAYGAQFDHGVSVTHVGSNRQNSGSRYVTESTTSGIPTTATPIAVTTAIPVTYRTTYVEEQPKSNIKQVFGVTHPAVSYVQPTVVAVRNEYAAPNVQVTNYNQGLNYNEAAVFKTESAGYDYPKPAVKFEDGNVHTTAAPILKEYDQPTVSTYQPHAFTQQTIHQADYNGYSLSAVAEEPFKKIVAYTTGEPTVTAYAQPTVSTVSPQSYSHQTIHKVEAAKVDSYVPSVAVADNAGYQYSQPTIKFEEHSVSTVAPQSYRHQTVHQYEAAKPSISVGADSGYQYPQPTVKFVEQPKLIEIPQTTPQPVVSTYKPQVYNQQTIHKVENSQSYASADVSGSSGYEYSKPVVIYEEAPRTYVEYSTPQPAVSTYKPQVYSQQTIHKVENSQSYASADVSGSSGYEYSKPVVKYEEAPRTYVEYSTPQPVVSTYRPHAYSHQTYHKVEQQNFVPVSSTSLPQVVKYEQPAVTLYQNPLVQFTQKATPTVSYVKPTELVYSAKQYVEPLTQQHAVKHVTASQSTYQPIEQNNYENQQYQINQAYSYNQPEIQRDIGAYNAGDYSQSTATSHQVYHENVKSRDYQNVNNKVHVSTTPAHLIYEDHYSEYETGKNINAYKADEYLPPKQDQSTSAPVVAHQSVYNSQHQYEFKPREYSELYEYSQKSVPSQQYAFSTAHEQQKKILSVNSYPSRTVSTTYKPIAYDAPEIQVGYRAEEYLPPVGSTVKHVTSTYRPFTVSTTEYLPPAPEPKYTAPEYLPPKVDISYLPPSTTVKTFLKSTTQTPTYKYEEHTTPAYKAPEYLPPHDDINEPRAINFESFGLRNQDNAYAKIKYNPFQEYTDKKYDAPVVVSTTVLPVQRKQNIVVETAKSNLLGFGTVGPDAGLVLPAHYTTAAPSVSDYSTPQIISSTYAPIKQELVEVTPSPIPRRTKPKVAVVTKINDFNPLLVKKLGAVCSCQTPVLVLRGRKPNKQTPSYDDDYDGNDYIDSGRGDIDDKEFTQARVPAAKTATVAPFVKSTFNPIIVPDDSFYQDYQEARQSAQSKEVYSESYVASTPAAVLSPSTERIVKIRPRVNAVTVAPTYRTVLLNDVTPTAILEAEGKIESQSFDRYGPGGLRSRDETLQGSVDCQRAGLFRHPKQCNKFYACRWDCTKQRFTLHVFNCPVQLSFDPSIGACNWPSQGPACQGDTLLTNAL